ncbi:Rieske 2Fe-2S domain-containing protein [Candidatus Woesearchaeota archaeon]|nr:Rieske 2Fe-2S domain-containing protein [Candidatus Woesearchaeota archaeon]
MTYTQAAKVNEISENTGKKVEINGKAIALFKKDGKVYAINNECPHAGGPLSEGTIEGDCIVCPWHGFSYDLKTGKSQQQCEVQTYPVKIDGDKILVDA